MYGPSPSTKFESGVKPVRPRRRAPARAAAQTARGERALYIAHEVNQPLAAILTNAEAALVWLAKNPPDLDEAREAIERVVGNSGRAADVVRSFRETACGSAPAIAGFEIAINDIIDKLLDLLHLDLRRHRIAVETAFGANLAVRADGDQIERVIANLVTNAVQAMSGVDGRPRRLRIGSEGDGSGGVLVSIADTGEGLDPAHLGRIFDPFFTTKRGGTGLGLPICRSIVEAHGGRLWAAPNLPHGSVFRFTLPNR
ncbi:MAG: HAMP domain-containing sensor histidine kinase [Rhizomicrobium sp.]